MYKYSKFSYSKKESTIISGIALCMMFVHHILGFPTWVKYPNECIYLINIGSLCIGRVIADSCLLCVSIFAFNTGYALYTAKEKFTFKKNLKRIFNFLVSYWIIYLLFICYGFFFKEELPNLKEFCLNLIGLECSPSSFINVPFAWYVNFYILFILVSPLVLYCTKGKNKIKDLIFIVIWLVFSCISFIFNIYALSALFKIGTISIFAYFISKYELLSFLQIKFKYDLVVNLIVAISILFLRFFLLRFISNYTNYTFSFLQDCIYAPLFILFTTNAIKHLNENNLIKVTLSKIGILSMNMWFIHGIFFTGSNKIQWILYYPKYSFLIILWGLLLTYFIAVPISKIQTYSLEKLKESYHHLLFNYKF